jgi:hypothetical protein
VAVCAAKYADRGQQIFQFTAGGKFSSVLTSTRRESSNQRLHLFVPLLLCCIKRYAMHVEHMAARATAINMEKLRSASTRAQATPTAAEIAPAATANVSCRPCSNITDHFLRALERGDEVDQWAPAACSRPLPVLYVWWQDISACQNDFLQTHWRLVRSPGAANHTKCR